MSLNPYATPQCQEPPATSKARPREIFIRWEKLRLVYNAVLALPGLGSIFVAVRSIREPFWIAAGAYIIAASVSVGANLCFLLGPLAELCLRATFFRERSFDSARRVLFGLGLSFSLIVLAVAALSVGKW